MGIAGIGGQAGLEQLFQGVQAAVTTTGVRLFCLFDQFQNVRIITELLIWRRSIVVRCL